MVRYRADRGLGSTQRDESMTVRFDGNFTQQEAIPEDAIARAVEVMRHGRTVLSGSYMLYARHGAVPDEDAFQRVRLQTPNCSGRMDDLRAAILRPQLDALDRNVLRWNERYRSIANALAAVDGLRLTERPSAETFVGSSIQMFAEASSPASIRELIRQCVDRGVGTQMVWRS